MKYTDSQIRNLLASIYEGLISPDNLPEDLYLAIADYLKRGLYDGFQGGLSDFKLGTPDFELISQLRDNVYIFSGAKTFQQIKEMSFFASEAKTFTDFKKMAMEVYEQYNKTWLETEYNTAVGQAQQAKQWNQIEEDKEIFPYLRYSAVMDDRTSDICAPLNDLVLPVDDPMWDKYAPLNHFNCRCVLERIDRFEDVKVTPKYKVSEIEKDVSEQVQPEFKMNPGKSGYIFSPKHPYFQVDKSKKEFAKRNFDLPIPDED